MHKIGYTQTIFIKSAVLALFLLWAGMASASTLSLSPATGVYSSGQTFTVNVVVNTQGQSINAAEGTLSFNQSALSVVRVAKGSLFNLWTAEPSFSNSAGTVSFSGGTPTGYKGGAGAVLSVTFKVIGSGSAKVSFSSGAVLAADGRGTNVLASMNSGTYTLSSQTSTPAPEVIIEYVPPANTPGAPSITSSSHANPEAWHKAKTADLAWSLPAGVTGVRTLLDSAPTSVPTKVYDEPISRISLPDLPEGVSYFHVQFRNSDGWGKIAHYRLAVDSEAPKDFVLALPEGADLSKPAQTLAYTVDESGSPVRRFVVQIDGGEAFEYVDTDGTGTIVLPVLSPGYHTVIAEAFDAAGNSVIGTVSITIASFEKPVFTEYPDRIGTNVIPVIKGTTRPRSSVAVTFTQIGIGVSSAETAKVYTVASDDAGNFAVIPDGRLATGVYELTAVSTDEHGSQSEASDPIRVVVEEPGYVRIGSFAVSVLSVLVPLLALVGLLIFTSSYILARMKVLKRGVARESREAESMLVREFKELRSLLSAQRDVLAASRKTGKLTKSEQDILEEFSHALTEAEQRVMKEIEDVTDIVT